MNLLLHLQNPGPSPRDLGPIAAALHPTFARSPFSQNAATACPQQGGGQEASMVAWLDV